MISDTGKTEKRLILDFVKIGKLSISVLVVYYMWYNERYGHNTIVVYVSFLLMCACLLIDVFNDGKLSFDDYHIGIWGNFAIVLYSFVTGFFVAYSQSALLESLKMVVQYSMISFAVYHFAKKSEKGMDWFLITVNFAALLCCYSLVRHPVERISGRFSISNLNNPNTLGFMLVIGIFSIVHRFKGDIKWLSFYFPQEVIMMYGIIRTGSRKALIAAAILIVIWVIEVIKEFNSQDGRNSIILGILFVIIIIVGVRYLVSVYSQSEIAFRMESMLDEESNGNRMDFYKIAWQIFVEKPLLGGGLNQFRYWSGTGAYSHSTYAEAIADFGLVGCIIYFFPIFKSGYSLLQKINDDDENYQKRIVLALWGVEMFMGIGQIFFFDIMHFFAWTVIYITAIKNNEQNIKIQKSKYIK